MNFSRAFEFATPLLLEGLKMTVLISLAAIAIGVAIGFVSCLFAISNSKILRFLSGLYVWVVRGTPMLVQGLLVFFGVPQLVQLFVPSFRISVAAASLITLSLNSGAYLSEIFRGGIKAVDSGQSEAARSLGLSRSRTMIKIVLPQAVRVAIPSMVNQFIITIKDSSILSAIGLAELVNKAKTYVGSTYQYFETYMFVALYYLVIISVLMVISKQVEKKLSYERKSNR